MNLASPRPIPRRLIDRLASKAAGLHHSLGFGQQSIPVMGQWSSAGPGQPDARQGCCSPSSEMLLALEVQFPEPVLRQELVELAPLAPGRFPTVERLLELANLLELRRVRLLPGELLPAELQVSVLQRRHLLAEPGSRT